MEFTKSERKISKHTEKCLFRNNRSIRGWRENKILLPESEAVFLKLSLISRNFTDVKWYLM